MDGIILINKQKGCTSHDVVYKVKRLLNEKVGHTGTLDPMATGVLPLLIGKGTLCSKYLMNHDKIYRAKIQLGFKTETADAEGKIIVQEEVSDNILNEKKVTEALNSFIGIQQQIPPIYSAIKVNGKKLYEYARKGQTVELEPRQIEIYNIQLLRIDCHLKQIEFEVSCSKGTYIRSLCEDIAGKLGTIGFMQELQRVQVGNFNIKETITIEELEKKLNSKDELILEPKDDSKIELSREKVLEKELYFQTIEKLFEKCSKIELDNRKLQLFLNGVKLTMPMKEDIYKIYNNEKFIGIGIVKNNLLKRDIIL